MAIKKLQNNFTSPEQSKRLLELGVPMDSADCYRRTSERSLSRLYERWTDAELHKNFFTHIPDVTPSWSVGRLMEIIEICSRYSPWQFDFTGTRIEQLIQAFDFLSMLDKFDFSKLEE